MAKFKTLTLLLSLLVTLSLAVAPLSLAADGESEIDTTVVLMSFEEPLADNYNGYMNIRVPLVDGGFRFFTFEFRSIIVDQANAVNPDPQPFVNVTFSGNSITFDFTQYDGYLNFYFISHYTQKKSVLIDKGAIGVNDTYTYTFPDTYDVNSKFIQLYGCMTTAVSPSNNDPFTFLWAGDALIYDELNQIFSKLNTIDADTSNISSKINSIYTELKAQGSSLDTIITKLNSISTIVDSLSTIYTELLNQGITIDDINDKLNYLITITDELFEQGLVLDDINTAIQSIDAFLDAYLVVVQTNHLEVINKFQALLTEFLRSNSALATINATLGGFSVDFRNYVDDMINDDSYSDSDEQSTNASNESDKLVAEMEEMLQNQYVPDKPTHEEIMEDIEEEFIPPDIPDIEPLEDPEPIDFVATFFNFIAQITHINLVGNILIYVFTLGLLSFVFFGKRG